MKRYSEPLSRIHAHQFAQPVKPDNPGHDKFCIQHGKRRFKPDYTESTARKSAGFFLRRMRSVVRCDHIDRSVSYAVDKRLTVIIRSERRIHSEAAITCNINYNFILTANFCTYSSTKTESHSSKTT